MDITLALSTQPFLRGNRIGILTTGGGLGVHMADLCAMNGFKVPSLDKGTSQKLERLMPAFGSAKNPVDLSGQLDPSLPAQAVKIVADDENIDAVVFILTSFPDVEISKGLLRLYKETKKPVFFILTAGETIGETYNYFIDHGVPVFPSPCRTVNALNGLRQHFKYRKRLQ